ncbi:hypothetical protein NDU88_007289 [Pleurodeles waltl]|uniref:Uncharacterized protein n=1 Tax=Pleurodeles waltl TaxID=8319 RepID=A0AAV7WG15_PLEWA|nr:hypothetical protein NDU88_007289 [Pleurodeles waltl]
MFTEIVSNLQQFTQGQEKVHRCMPTTGAANKIWSKHSSVLALSDGEESSSGLSTSDDESSSRRSPTDVIQKVIAWNQNRKYLERMTKQSLENLRRVVDLSQDNPFLPGHLKDGNCTEQDDKKPKKL